MGGSVLTVFTAAAAAVGSATFFRRGCYCLPREKDFLAQRRTRHPLLGRHWLAIVPQVVSTFFCEEEVAFCGWFSLEPSEGQSCSSIQRQKNHLDRFPLPSKSAFLVIATLNEGEARFSLEQELIKRENEETVKRSTSARESQ
ncbi:unnamed protein product [Arctia plantaginis]|uniref:Secreted protein n=1 Tax=Arctia plantaginis TaxID=874455 RepID=A0A8S1BKY0_ARCPL|nr:unnamed protein product [Arctia plantaginis]